MASLLLSIFLVIAVTKLSAALISLAACGIVLVHNYGCKLLVPVARMLIVTTIKWLSCRTTQGNSTVTAAKHEYSACAEDTSTVILITKQQIISLFILWLCTI